MYLFSRIIIRFKLLDLTLFMPESATVLDSRHSSLPSREPFYIIESPAKATNEIQEKHTEVQ